MSEEGPRAKGDSGTGAPEEDATVVRSQASPPAQTLLYAADALGEAATQVRSFARPSMHGVGADNCHDLAWMRGFWSRPEIK